MTATDRRLLALALGLALVIGVGWRLTDRGPFAEGSSHQVTIHELEGCGIPADVVVDDRVYEADSAWPDAWPPTKTGELEVGRDDTAAFLTDDGYRLRFHRVEGAPSLGCPAGAG